jgi:hypothetical protein
MRAWASRPAPRGLGPLLGVLTGAILVAAAIYFVRGYSNNPGITPMADFVLYRDAGARWLAGDGFYLSRQLAGPYTVTIGDVLYPPPTVLVFALLAVLPLVLSAVVWWSVPVAAVLLSLRWLRPAAWSWPVLALTLWWPPTLDRIATGNPVLWITGAAYLAAVVPGPSIFVILKPTLAPFMFFRANHLNWLIAGIILIAISLPFGNLWVQYFQVIFNAKSFAGPAYSLEEFPMLAGALVAFAASERHKSK